ncbi:MAG: glycosyltransferase [bacterium]|nr:glycosyltransferase [bacterium]
MNNKILVSTITPCFRMKKYLKLFLDELPKQTMFNELEIVLDHNEPDPEEVEWVKEFQSKYPGRIKHIIIPKVDPIGTSMNRCIKEASGKYVTIWNVDDLRTPNSIELQYKMLEENSEYGLAYGNYVIVRNFGSEIGKLVDHSKIPETELTRSMITGPFIFWRKDLSEKAGYFDEQLIQGPDFDLSVRLAFHTKAKMTTEILGFYLNEGKGMSTKPDSPQPIERVTIELRYGICDKIDYDHVVSSSKYSTPFIKEFGVWNPVSKYVPNYTSLLAERKKLWYKKGMRRYILGKILFFKPIRNNLKKGIKKIIKIYKK